jgi:AraC-like DNA-binding protein
VKARFAGPAALPAISVPLAQPPRDDEDRRLLEALTVALAEHLDDERFTADALAQSLGLSRSAMYRRLQPLLGRSPIDAVWEYRLLQAAQWLTETDITVSEIAYGVGFKTVPHFSARFRERFGDTPSQYRERRVS